MSKTPLDHRAVSGGRSIITSKWVLLLFFGQVFLVVVYFLLLFEGIGTPCLVLVLCSPFLLAFLLALTAREALLVPVFGVTAALAGLGFLPGIPGFNTGYVVAVMLVFVGSNLILRLTDVNPYKREAMPRSYRSLLLVLVVALLASTSLAWARGLVNVGLITGVCTFLLSGIVVYFLSGSFDDVRRVKQLVFTIVVAAVSTSVIWLPTLLGTAGKRMTMPFQSVAVGLNEVGGTLAMLAVLVMGILVSGEKGSKKLLLGVSFFILVLGLILTKSRGAWVGSLAGLAYVFLRTRRIKLILFSLIIISLAASVLQPVKTSFVDRLSQTEAGDPSLLGRVLMWQTALKIIPRNLLLGIGLHNFGVVKYAYGFPRFLDPIDASLSCRPSAFLFGHTHNLYLELLMDIGVFGFAAFALIVALTIVGLNRLAGSAQQIESRGPALGLAALLIAYMIHSLFDYLLWIPHSLVVFAMFLGMSLALIRLSKQ